MSYLLEVDVEELLNEPIKLVSTERDCPKCISVLVLNENEQCYECLDCGYIHCGDD